MNDLFRPGLSKSTRAVLHELSEPGESTDDTISRILENHPDEAIQEIVEEHQP